MAYNPDFFSKNRPSEFLLEMIDGVSMDDEIAQDLRKVFQSEHDRFEQTTSELDGFII